MFVTCTESKYKRAKVFVDGEDISNHCYAADSDLGVALGYVKNKEGRHYKDPETGSTKKVLYQGKIEIFNVMED
jgi:hypothetical protein